MLNITLHSRERALERFNIKGDKAEEKLNSLLEQSVEVFQTNNGRAFKNKQHGMVLITDQQKQNILTVYHAKGHEIDINDLDSLIASDLGSINDVTVRRSILSNVLSRINELELKQLLLEKEQVKRSTKIVNLKLRAMTTKTDEVFLKAYEEQTALSTLNKTAKKEIDEIQKIKNGLIKDVSFIFGVDLTVSLNVYRFRKNEIYKTLREEGLSNGQTDC